MQTKRIFLTMTMVLFSQIGYAAPHKKSQPAEDTHQETIGTESFDLEENNLILSPMPPGSEERLKRPFVVYPYRQSYLFRTGGFFNAVGFSDLPEFKWLLGLGYLWPSYTRRQIETSVELASDTVGFLSYGWRWTNHPYFGLRNFYKTGITHKSVARERLAGLTNYENYLVYLGIGLEDYLYDPKSVRFDLEVAIGTIDRIIFLKFGYTWGVSAPMKYD